MRGGMAAAAVVLRSPPAVAAAVVWRGRRAVSRLFAAAAGLRGRSGGRPPFRRERGPRPRRWGRSRGGEARVGLCRSLPLPNPPPPAWARLPPAPSATCGRSRPAAAALVPLDAGGDPRRRHPEEEGEVAAAAELGRRREERRSGGAAAGCQLCGRRGRP